jgi:hypothetical protein
MEGPPLTRIGAFVHDNVVGIAQNLVNSAVLFRDFGALSGQRRKHIRAPGDLDDNTLPELIREGQGAGQARPPETRACARLAVELMASDENMTNERGGRPAEVIKVEPPAVDPMRRFCRPATGTSSFCRAATVRRSMWVDSNRAEHGLLLKLQQTDDHTGMRELLGSADVLVSNCRQDVAEGLGLPDGPAATDVENVVRGPALDFCLVVTQRCHRADTTLEAIGPVADRWLDVAQAFAGPPGEKRQPGDRHRTNRPSGARE